MAIQIRYGDYADFQPEKMVTAELACVISGDPAVTDGKSLYLCFAPGVVKRITTYADFERELQSVTEDIQSAFTQDIQDTIQDTINVINNANEAISQANEAKNQALSAAAAAQEAAGEAIAAAGGDISQKTVTFEQAENRENINSGDSTATLFGKIKKWFADLGTAAFQSVANNLTTTAEGSVLDARQGKTLKDEINELNTNLDLSGTNIHCRTEFHVIGNYVGSLPIPFPNADKYNFYVTRIAVFGGGLEPAFPWELEKSNSNFSLLINDSDAAYYFETAYPGRVWDVYFSAVLI